MSNFIGREAQLKLLESAWHGDGGMLTLIYGRRRIGKTELIRHFIHNKSTVFFTGKETKPQILIDDFLSQAKLCFGYEIAKEGEVTSWKAAIRLILADWRKDERLILVFDELQWAAAASPELIGTLQELWDHEWKDNPKVGIILCTSFVAYALKLVGSQSPLFGRTTLNIPLQPFLPAEAKQFHPHYKDTDLAQIYFICGGVPLYHLAFATNLPFRQNLTNSLLSPAGSLYREGESLMRAEFQDMPSYFAILTALAEKPRRNKDILELMDVKDAHYYLERLMRVGYIHRILPIANRVPRTEVRYAICDAFLRWWFFFLFRNLSAVELLGPEESFTRIIAPQLDRFFAQCFEDFCRSWLQRHYITHEGATGEVVVGQYWRHETVQIDVVGKRTKDRWIDIGECKWGKVKSLPAVMDELERKAADYPLPKDFSLGRRLFLHHSPEKQHGLEIKIHTLEEMLK
jgi:hypothetical protein